MKNKNISQEALKTIKDKKIKPKPKWEFLAKDYLIWFFSVLTVLVGGLAVSIIILIISHPGLRGRLFLLNIPYVWFLVLLVFLILAYYNFKKTKKGYQYNPYLIVVISVLISIIFGFVIFQLGQAEKAERVFYQKVPIYRQMMHRQFETMPMHKPMRPFLEKRID